MLLGDLPLGISLV